MKQKTIIGIVLITILFIMSITNLVVNFNQSKINEKQQVQIDKLIEQNKELNVRLTEDESYILGLLDLIEEQQDLLQLWFY